MGPWAMQCDWLLALCGVVRAAYQRETPEQFLSRGSQSARHRNEVLSNRIPCLILRDSIEMMKALKLI